MRFYKEAEKNNTSEQMNALQDVGNAHIYPLSKRLNVSLPKWLQFRWDQAWLCHLFQLPQNVSSD